MVHFGKSLPFHDKATMSIKHLALCSLQVISGWISVLSLQKNSAKSGRPPRIQKSLQKFLGKNSRLGTSSINSYSENDSFLCRRTVEPFKNLEWDIPKTRRGKWKNVRNCNRPKRWAKLKNFELEAQEPQNVGWVNGVFQFWLMGWLGWLFFFLKPSSHNHGSVKNGSLQY